MPTVDEIEALARSGNGLIVIVEGDDYTQDPFYYERWFGASDIAFFPQDGWIQVKSAVETLRTRTRNQRYVYGIIDRDFCSDTELESLFQSSGVLRTTRYTLENYLLDADTWAAVFRQVYMRDPMRAQDWGDPSAVSARIESAYRANLPVSAYNYIVNDVNVRYPERSRSSTRAYAVHANEATNSATQLRIWQKELGISDDLESLFRARLDTLRNATLEEWATCVTGKPVLRSLHAMMPPSFPGNRRYDLDLFLNLYMSVTSRAPDDLSRLIDRITEHARQKGWRG